MLRRILDILHPLVPMPMLAPVGAHRDGLALSKTPDGGMLVSEPVVIWRIPVLSSEADDALIANI